MSDRDDYPYEMRKYRALDDRAIEAFFAGRELPDPGDAELALFAQIARTFARQAAPVPTGALAGLLAGGLANDKGDLPATAASNATGPVRQAAGLPKWRRYRMALSQLLTALLAKFGALGLAAKGGLLMALAAATVTAAGATGALPTTMQNTVAHAVNAVTPLHFPTDPTSAGSQSSTGLM